MIKRKGNWCLFNCPSQLKMEVIDYVRYSMTIPLGKKNNTNVHLSIKKGLRGTYFRIILEGTGKKEDEFYPTYFIYLDMNQYEYYICKTTREEGEEYDGDSWFYDPEDDYRWKPYAKYKKVLKKYTSKSRGELKCEAKLSNIRTKCYKYIDSILRSIPMMPENNPKMNFFLMLRQIRKKGNIDPQHYSHISESSSQYIFIRLSQLPREILGIIIGHTIIYNQKFSR